MANTEFDVYKWDKYNPNNKGLFAVVISKDDSESTMLITKDEVNQLIKRLYIALEEAN